VSINKPEAIESLGTSKTMSPVSEKPGAISFCLKRESSPWTSLFFVFRKFYKDSLLYKPWVK